MRRWHSNLEWTESDANPNKIQRFLANYKNENNKSPTITKDSQMPYENTGFREYTDMPITNDTLRKSKYNQLSSITPAETRYPTVLDVRGKFRLTTQGKMKKSLSNASVGKINVIGDKYRSASHLNVRQNMNRLRATSSLSTIQLVPTSMHK